jgi:hypothetical protein
VSKRKKSRVPAPPRPVQAPKRRVQAPQRRVEQHGAGGSSRLLFGVLAAVIVLAAIVVGLLLAFRGGSGAAANGQDGPCVRQTFSPMGRQHVQKLKSAFQYNSFPPTSGPHYPIPAIWNIYDQPVPEIRLVHNLEHGGIVVQYGSKVPKTAVDQIAGWYAQSPNAVIVAPLGPLDQIPAKAPADADSKIYLTAWTHVAACTSFDQGAFDRFRDDYRGKGPERFPVDSLQPGT